ncbi:acyl-CoA thioesterase [Arthrobacter sp. UM1]|uniref:acyl-CoA thioesterase n=1 Tax=Arthrobacter sp. UM1 TaxID=2766776 RepID=UPI001CF6F7F5|nr:acyl-CoA thioesterase [Arthrobacter sp. UM1]
MHTITIQMRWGDIDQYRHVNNVRYAQYLEDARVLLMHQPIADFAPDHPRAAESIWDLLKPDNVAFIARQEIEYREATEYSPEPLEVLIGVSSIGGSSYDFAYEVRQDGRLKTVAEVSVVVVDKDSGRPARITPELKSVLEALRCDPAPLRRRRSGA